MVGRAGISPLCIFGWLGISFRKSLSQDFFLVSGIFPHFLKARQCQLALENFTEAVASDRVQEEVDAVIEYVEELGELHHIR